MDLTFLMIFFFSLAFLILSLCQDQVDGEDALNSDPKCFQSYSPIVFWGNIIIILCLFLLNLGAKVILLEEFIIDRGA